MVYSPKVYKDDVEFLETKTEFESEINEPNVSKLHRADTLKAVYIILGGIVSCKVGDKNKILSEITPEYFLAGIESILGKGDYSSILQLFKIRGTYFYSIATLVEEYDDLLNELNFDNLSEVILSLQEATGMGKELINCLNIAFPDKMKGVE